jgi:hypothetical protein
MAKALNRCYFTAGSSGTAHFDDGTAVQGFRNLSDAGAQHGVEYAYVAENAARTEVEMGVATYNSGNGQLERADADVEWSTNSNDRVNFTNPPFVLIVRRAQDVVENTLNGNQITVVDEDNMASDSATAVPTQQSVKAYADNLLAVADAMVFKGGIDASSNPNYPAANAGHTYKITVAGKIGGASGPAVEVNDTIICTVDSSASGNHATVGANWVTLQSNIDSAAPQFTTIELGHASDTTLSRSASGVIAVEGVPIYPQIPQTSLSANTTLSASHANRHLLHPSSDNNARTFTIDSNTNLPLPIGTVFVFVNKANVLSIAITSDTLTWAPSGGTGTRQLAANGIATAMKIGSTEWIISGVGLT